MPLPKTLDIPPLGPNIKSTLNGLLSAAIAILIAVSALPNGVKWPVVALAVLRAVGGIMTKDAGVTEAVTTTGEVKAVPSHEVPTDPAHPLPVIPDNSENSDDHSAVSVVRMTLK